ncbi:nicotinate-nucleotide--dimethylbenzimidazole phosphoribosyltransferase [Chloroflexi bacterium]|nr:nicotinate-nucleotide--dimethylbenzimidazole phosphoribosyltransferase [Chloroflexota bacterium]
MDLIREINKSIDSKTKPIGSLGRIEDIARKICLIQKSTNPILINPKIVIFAGDHGIANSGVSKYPQEVTNQMVKNFLNGGAAINVFSSTHSIKLLIVDAGVNYEFENTKNLINKKIDFGTKNFINQKAMNKKQLEECFKSGKKIIQDISLSGTNIIGFGEMGIANTSSATMIMSSLLNLPIEKCVGTGTGLNQKQLKIKTNLLEQAKQFHGTINDIYEVLQTFGGFEILQMCSAILESYKKNMIIMVDGFISTCAYLAASKINPKIIDNVFFSHKSPERGHNLLLNKIDEKPILNLDMRLGEGTGCALLYPIILNSVNFINNMATFKNAKVSTKIND